MTSKERVRKVIFAQRPDHLPLYDLLRNDAVIEYYAGEKITRENVRAVVFRAIGNCLDAMRNAMGFPNEAEREELLPDGRKRMVYRWTVWTEHKAYKDAEDYVKSKKKLIKNTWDWSGQDQDDLESSLKIQEEYQRSIGDVYWIWGLTDGPGLYEEYCEIGLEAFSYFWMDCPGILQEYFDYKTAKAIQRIEHIPDGSGVETVNLSQDIAFKTGCLFSPAFLRKEYFPRLARIIAAYHKKGIKVQFHSDGNLMDVMEDLIKCGIDLLNPLEVIAGMNPREIHQRYPDLVFSGGIDVSQLLPFGTELQIREAVKKLADDVDGKILVGSTTELQNTVPLRNFMVMKETVENCRL